MRLHHEHIRSGAVVIAGQTVAFDEYGFAHDVPAAVANTAAFVPGYSIHPDTAGIDMPDDDPFVPPIIAGDNGEVEDGESEEEEEPDTSENKPAKNKGGRPRKAG